MILDAVPETQWQETEDLNPRKILIIDDDQEQCRVLKYRLDKQGFHTFTAHRAKTGVQRAQDERPDAILLDIRLPDGDGLEVCEQLADDPTTADIPIIVVSGCERPNVVRQARKAGSRFYVRKPYDPNALLLLIVDAIDSDDPAFDS